MSNYPAWLEDFLRKLFEALFDEEEPRPEPPEPPDPPKPPKPEPPKPEPKPESDALAVLRLTNAERASRGLALLRLDDDLNEFAQNWSETQDREGRMYHSDLDFKGTARAENVARGQDSPEEVMAAWMNSDGHRRNILGSQYRGMGLGRSGDYWTQVFSNLVTAQPKPDPEPPAPEPEPDGPFDWQNGRELVFHDPFDGNEVDRSKWNVNSTWSYPGGGPTNRPNGKLDYFDDDAIEVADGMITFTARPRRDGLWSTGLITTGDSRGRDMFALRTGDFHVGHFQLPDDDNMGAWPALWTWNNGGNEIDTFEYHTDNPNLLEFTNHVRGGGKYYTNRDLVKPGGWLWIGTDFQRNSCTYYVGESLETLRPVFSDSSGVGNWSAYVIINLSIVDGRWHPRPTNDRPIIFRCADYRVYR